MNYVCRKYQVPAGDEDWPVECDDRAAAAYVREVSRVLERQRGPVTVALVWRLVPASVHAAAFGENWEQRPRATMAAVERALISAGARNTWAWPTLGV
jgi:hypothetical protein